MTAIVYLDHPTQEGGIEIKRGSLEECLGFAQYCNARERFGWTCNEICIPTLAALGGQAFCWVEVME